MVAFRRAPHRVLLALTLALVASGDGVAATAAEPPHNAASFLLQMAGADTLTVEFTKALAKGDDGALRGTVSPALRAALLEALDAQRYRLVGLEEVAAPLTEIDLSADGRKIRLGYPDAAAAERARTILKGYHDLITALVSAGNAVPEGAGGKAGAAMRDFLLAVKFAAAGSAVAVDLPDPAALQAALQAAQAGAGDGDAPADAGGKAGSSSPESKCLSLLKTIEGAIELYNLEKEPDAPQPSLDDLVGEYLKRKPDCPEGGPLEIRADGTPRCPRHGTIEEIEGAKKGGERR